MPQNHGLRKQRLQVLNKLSQPLLLLRRPSISRLAVSIEPALVANADGAAVIRPRMGAYLEEEAVLRRRAVAADVKVVAHGAEPARFVVARELADGVGSGAAGGGTVENDVADAVGPLHLVAVFNASKEVALREHGPLANY